MAGEGAAAMVTPGLRQMWRAVASEEGSRGFSVLAARARGLPRRDVRALQAPGEPLWTVPNIPRTGAAGDAVGQRQDQNPR